MRGVIRTPGNTACCSSLRWVSEALAPGARSPGCSCILTFSRGRRHDERMRVALDVMIGSNVVVWCLVHVRPAHGRGEHVARVHIQRRGAVAGALRALQQRCCCTQQQAGCSHRPTARQLHCGPPVRAAASRGSAARLRLAGRNADVMERWQCLILTINYLVVYGRVHGDGDSLGRALSRSQRVLTRTTVSFAGLLALSRHNIRLNGWTK